MVERVRLQLVRNHEEILLEDVPTETLMRTFDSLPTDFRLSVPYVARIIRIDGRQAAPDPPVTTAITGLVPGTSP